MKEKPNYGLDAPDVVRRLFLVAGIVLLAGIGSFSLQRQYRPARWLTWPLLEAGVAFLFTPTMMVWGSRVGKLRLRDRVIGSLNLRGDERVLDVGCGHGLLLIAAAKRLTTGSATGIDLWQTEDQAGNNAEATLHNAVLEGVRGRVKLEDGDARQLPFDAGTFDVVLSSWALHNIYEEAGRHRALEEIVRVLRPGGQVAILDIRHTREYADALRALGLAEINLSGPNFIFVIPTRCLTARKPAIPRP